jgi:hypothetical protein
VYRLVLPNAGVISEVSTVVSEVSGLIGRALADNLLVVASFLEDSVNECAN